MSHHVCWTQTLILQIIKNFSRLKQFKFNTFMQTWICSTGSPKLAIVCDFKAPGCGSTFRSLCRKMKHSSMYSLRKLYQFKLTNFMTKKAGRNSLNFSAGRTNKTFSKNSQPQKKKVLSEKVDIDLTNLLAPISGFTNKLFITVYNCKTCK